MNSYLVTIFDAELLDGLGPFLNTKKEILNWYRIVNIYAVISECNTKKLHEMLCPYFDNNQAMYLISKISGNEANGAMPKRFWKFINNPKSSGYWETGNAKVSN